MQRGYSAHPQNLDYEGRKHTAPHTYTADSSLLLCISCSDATQHIHRFWMTKAGNTQPPTHLLLKQPTLYISCSEATQHIRQILNYKGRKHTAPHTFTAEAAYAVHFLQRGYSAHPTDSGLRRQETHSPPHIYCRQQPTLYISCSEATQHIHRLWIIEGRKHTAPHTFTAEAAYAVHLLQRGYSAHPQILDYEGKKHTAPHTFAC